MIGQIYFTDLKIQINSYQKKQFFLMHSMEQIHRPDYLESLNWEHSACTKCCGIQNAIIHNAMPMWRNPVTMAWCILML